MFVLRKAWVDVGVTSFQFFGKWLLKLNTVLSPWTDEHWFPVPPIKYPSSSWLTFRHASPASLCSFRVTSCSERLRPDARTWLTFISVFPQSMRGSVEYYFKVYRSHFLSRPLQFNIHSYLSIRDFMIYVVEKVSLNNLSRGLLIALMMEALLISETSVYFCEKTRYHIFKSLLGGWSRVRTFLMVLNFKSTPEFPPDWPIGVLSSGLDCAVQRKT
jgi:hypothetical protein